MHILTNIWGKLCALCKVRHSPCSLVPLYYYSPDGSLKTTFWNFREKSVFLKKINKTKKNIFENIIFRGNCVRCARYVIHHAALSLCIIILLAVV